MSSSDIWANWLRHRRHGGDLELHARMMETLKKFRDRVLENACLMPGDCLLDVGCGDGLIGFGALERLGPKGSVVFSDISLDLLSQCRETAKEMGLSKRCRFVEARAEDLSGIDDVSVDIVTTRSVLIYVSEKERAFAQFHRVLKPDGRLSVFEPINRFPVQLTEGDTETLYGYDMSPVADVIQKLKDAFKVNRPKTETMVDFDERDLVKMAFESGFIDIHMELQLEVGRKEPRLWKHFIESSGNPLEPTLREVMDKVLTAQEQQRLTLHMRPLIESGAGLKKSAIAYLWAKRP